MHALGIAIVASPFSKFTAIDWAIGPVAVLVLIGVLAFRILSRWTGWIADDETQSQTAKRTVPFPNYHCHSPTADGRQLANSGRLHVAVTSLHIAVTTSVVVVLLGLSHYVQRQTSDFVMLAYWYFGATVLATCLACFIVGRRYTRDAIAPGRILCIVPAYNEDLDGLHATVQSLLRQTVPVDIVVIDDGSQIPVIPRIHNPRVKWYRQENTGKRGAQVAVLRKYDPECYQFILTVDSDSEPYPDACEHLLRAMTNPRIQAGTGMIYVRNYAKSWVSLAADIDIGTSCIMMRASRSMLGALETTSGALALYRSKLLYDHLDRYAVECGTGDDRWLALRALRRGEVVAVAEAGVETDMPTTLNGTYRQRLRWARSWWWMLPYVFKYLSFRQLISPLYGLVQLALTPVLLGYIVVETVSSTTRYSNHASVLAIYLSTYVLVRYAVAGLYLIGRPNVPREVKWRLWLVGTPAAVFLNVILLLPTRYFALSKLFDNRWQTREIDPTLLLAHQAAQQDGAPSHVARQLDQAML